MAGKTILTICSNMDAGQAGGVGGLHHVWLVVKSGDNPAQSFGLWPKWDAVDDNRLRRALKPGGWDGSGTDVQRGVEDRFSRYMPQLQTRSWVLDATKSTELMALLTKPATYVPDTNNCADWAYGIVGKITGVSPSPGKNFVAASMPFEHKDRTDIIPVTSPRYLNRSLMPCDFQALAQSIGLTPERAESLPVVMQPRPQAAPPSNHLTTGMVAVIAGIGGKLAKFGAVALS